MDNLASFSIVRGAARLGIDLGDLTGSAAGAIAGAKYNPDIIDSKTGDKRKLNEVERIAMILGGGATGSLAGKVGGALVGDVGGRALNRWAPDSKAASKMLDYFEKSPKRGRWGSNVKAVSDQTTT